MDRNIARRASSLRAFNRFYTRRIGVIGERVLGSPFSLAETRVLWELAHAQEGGHGHDEPDGQRDTSDASGASDASAPGGANHAKGRGATASSLVRTLGLDAGYVSRLLASLRRRGLVLASADPADRRRHHLRLSAAGRRAFAPLERRSQQQMSALLAPLADAEQRELLEATGRVQALLGGRRRESTPQPPLQLRPPRPGDFGWVIARHGALYAQQYGWDARFEALVARIAADFVEHFDPAREACWIAERNGERLGCVFLVQARREVTGAKGSKGAKGAKGKPSSEVEPGVAQLRMLLVEPAARGQGLGQRLVDECERFAREHGYRRIRLWTHSVLLAARGIYRAAGYRLVARERHASFGKKLVGETWELGLA